MAAQTYLRFVAPRALRATRVGAGIFGPAYAARNDPLVEEWLRDAIREEIGWFERNLDVPRRFGVVTRKSRRPHAGVCWFRDDARDCLRHADALAALVREAGVPIERLVSEVPGDIVWRDDRQIVAIPRLN